MATSLAARSVRIAVPALVVGAIVALRPEIATGTFSSATSVLKVGAAVAAWMVFAWLVRRHVTRPLARTTILATAGAAVAALTVLPYFRTTTVDDPLPVAAAPVTTVAAPQPAPQPAVETPSAPATTTPAGPVKLAAGALRGLAGHRGEGDVAIYRQPDGSLLVRLEDFAVSSVPAPVVYLVPGADQQRPAGIKLGGLRGSNGNQNFAVPPGTAVDGATTVLIWCEAFSVPVAGATTAAA